MLNPFRWKGHYYDEETGLYFANGRIYDPYLMQYLDADAPELLLSLATTPNSLDKNGITVDNSITYEANQTNIFPSKQLYIDNSINNQEIINGVLPLEWWQYTIAVGDLVLAYNELTGKQAYKEVLRLFRGKTTEWYHIHANGEEIICTAEHPFYVKEKGFVPASELTIKDKLTLSSGEQVTIEKIEIEHLDAPQTKYNFEVADYHTYYVTENKVLVHNSCNSERRKAVKEAWAQERELVAKTGKGTRKWNSRQKVELLTTGKVKGYEGHHINSVKGSLLSGGDKSLISNPNNIQFLTRREHLARHLGNFRNVTTGKLLSRAIPT